MACGDGGSQAGEDGNELDVDAIDAEERDARPDDAAADAERSDAESSDAESGDAERSDAEAPDAETDSDESDASEEVASDATHDDDAEDVVAPDVNPDADGDAARDAGDAGERACTPVSVRGPWVVEYSDSVSIEYRAAFSPDVDGVQPDLRLLFERYRPGPDVGRFTLGVADDPDGNFGTCAHCAYARGPSAVRAWFAREGEWEARLSPYGRRMDGTLRGLVLEEVEVDATRSSTPIEGGRCLAFDDIEIVGVYPTEGWTCDAEQFFDGNACHCTCGSYDPDCGDARECLPFDPECPPYVPLPVEGCGEEEYCLFDPVSGGTACTTDCEWEEREPCAAGVCFFDVGSDGRDTCSLTDERLDPAAIGAPCTLAPTTGLQLYCAEENGFLLGYCDAWNVCRAVCESDEECTEPGHTCRRFLVTEGLGYCGPEPPEDG